ncbi:MFS transporter [Rhodococcoides corynebacterioides]|uniref:Aromatic acid/H+ symport family MFS transporter n=1 Tax=Rhodococcoides corynebacterioides TaxID=53972 RepID=A0ABS7P710_9NOCA|nr:aromatic acid/H+ symport family MFS transporter [Rhodococcus corynebacterioides]MBY6367672.1 aromatic acid/H+ symport family MFS transporter [Rhodococcus corynebacterioides]MBY6407994.1 aromatic acid/H+ symport family MFS transporter [Rhodococcus corynebacterioides]
MTRPRPTRQRSGLLVLVLCFVTIVFDGYDLVVYGSTVPTLIAYEGWDLDTGSAGLIGSLALVGMLLGTLSVGLITDRFGRRRIMIGSIAWFSVCMLATAFAPNEVVFGVLRFLTGIGLGGVVPTCIALTVEFAPKGRRQIANAVMFSGYSVGGVSAALLAIALLPETDFRVLYALGALPLITLLPIVVRYLPESVSYLAATGREAEARDVAAQHGLVYDDVVAPVPAAAALDTAPPVSSMRELFTPRWRRSTLLFAAANFCGLLLVYGLNTWLPQIMRSAGFALGSSLAFLLVLNLGAIVGAISASFVADRIGVQKVVTASFLIACVAIFLISQNLPAGLLFLLVAVAGLGSVGTQILVGGFCATHYPQKLNATALAWSLGVGRIGAICGPLLGGLIAGWAFGYQVNFYAFAAVAVLGAAVVASVRTQVRRRDSLGAPTAPAAPTHAG